MSNPLPGSGTDGRKTLLLLQACFGLSAAVITLAAWKMGEAGLLPGPDFPGAEYLRPTLLLAVIILFPAVRALRRRAHAGLPTATANPYAGPLFLRYLVMFALAEMAAVMGAIIHLLGGERQTLLVCGGLALFYLLIATPPPDPHAELW